MNRKSLILGLCIAIASILITACGSGGSSSGEITVEVKDEFSFDPSSFSVSAGEEISITFNNTASVAHTFNILNAEGNIDQLLVGDEHDEEAEADDHDGGDDHSEEELHEQVVLEMHEVKPGESVTQTFTAPSESGDYVIFCSLPGHADAGMVGTLIVNP